MRFKFVELQNFLSYGPTAQRVDLGSRGLVAVIGQNEDSQGADSNGAGKSTIMESIVWALYGETMRGYKGDAVVNRNTGKDCAVSLVIEDGTTEYRITRSRKVTTAKKASDLQLWINGAEATQGTIADTQAVVQTIVGMDFATFTQSVMMWHGSRSFSQMTDREQKSVLEDILQIDQLSRAREAVKARIVACQQKLTKEQSDLESTDRRVQESQAHLGRLRQQQAQHATVVRQKRSSLRRKKVDAELRIEEVYRSTGLDKLLKLQDNIRNEEKQLSVRRQHVQQERLAVTRKYSEKREIVARTEGTAQGRLSQIQKDIESFDRLVGSPCPTCKQVLDPDAAESCVQDWEKEAEYLRSQTIVATAKARAKIDKQERAEIAELARRESDIQSEWQTLQARLQVASSDVRKRQAALSLICQLEQQAWSIQQEIDQLDEESDPYATLIADAEKQLEQCGRERRRSKYRLKSLEIELQHLNYWNQGFGNKGLKSYILDSVIPFLTQRAQEYADVVSGGDIQIEFSTQTQLKSGEWRDQFQVKAVNRQGADVYHGNSDGERRRIDIAVGWALADLAASRAHKSIRFRGLDEPFVHLDETGEDLVIKLLHKVLPQYETILCVTHSTHLRDQFPESIEVRCKGGFSQIQGGS